MRIEQEKLGPKEMNNLRSRIQACIRHVRMGRRAARNKKRKAPTASETDDQPEPTKKLHIVDPVVQQQLNNISAQLSGIKYQMDKTEQGEAEGKWLLGEMNLRLQGTERLVLACKEDNTSGYQDTANRLQTIADSLQRKVEQDRQASTSLAAQLALQFETKTFETKSMV